MSNSSEAPTVCCRDLEPIGKEPTQTDVDQGIFGPIIGYSGAYQAPLEPMRPH